MATNTDEIKKIKKEVNGIKESLATILEAIQAKNSNVAESTVNESEKTDDNKIKELEDKMSQILEKMNSVQNQPVYESEKKDNSLDRDVLFISLCVGTLNLSTRKNGDGDIYTFTEFGEEQMIPYMDAKNIIKNNKSFIKGGKVFISDEDLIKNERLTKDYEHILDYKGLMNLFNESSQTFEKIFKEMPRGQQESFTDILLQKMLKGEKIDRNLIYIVNQELNIDLEEKIENGKNLM